MKEKKIWFTSVCFVILLTHCGGSSSSAAKQEALDVATQLSLAESDLMLERWGSIDWPRPAHFRYYMTTQDTKALGTVLKAQGFGEPYGGKESKTTLDDLTRFTKGKFMQTGVNPSGVGKPTDGTSWLKKHSQDIWVAVEAHCVSKWNVTYAFDGRPITGCIVVIERLY